MLLIRAVLLEFLVCYHVIGGAVIFRRLFPGESPWLAFILPTLIVMSVCNFLEHYISMPNLGWLLPFTLGGLLWAMVRPGYSREGMWLPGILFVSLFTWCFFIKCLNPAITCNTEGVADMARVLDFCFGDTLPPTDSWCPPYDHGGYYSFQHYGASLLTRLFSLDIGTGYNMGYTLLNTLTCMAAAGAAYVISGNRTWGMLATLLIVLANFGGSAVILMIMKPSDVNFAFHQSVDIADGWNDPNSGNPFRWIFTHYTEADPPPALRLFPPTYNLWFPEFHANLGGHFMTLVSLLAANEAYREKRSNWPWICLVIFPFITIITSTWFFIVVGALCGGSILACLIASRRPDSWKKVMLGIGLSAACLWPSVDSLISGSYPVPFHWTWEQPSQFTPFWEFVIQWWPIIVPWFLLFFIWSRLNLLARWIHAAVPLLLIFVELIIFTVRMLPVEKMWGALYGAGLVTFLPLVFVEASRFDGIFGNASASKTRLGRFGSVIASLRATRSIVFLFTTILFIFMGGSIFAAWVVHNTAWVSWQFNAFHLKGDSALQFDPQKRRITQVLGRLHGATVLSRCDWSYNESPSAINFSGNRCYIAWFYQEYQCGHGGEAEFRNQQTLDFFDGKMADPLAFLKSNDIAAVVVWPEEAPESRTSDEVLAKLQKQIGSDYYYVDCKAGGDKNAGVFFRIDPNEKPVDPEVKPNPPTP